MGVLKWLLKVLRVKVVLDHILVRLIWDSLGLGLDVLLSTYFLKIVFDVLVVGTTEFELDS